MSQQLRKDSRLTNKLGDDLLNFIKNYEEAHSDYNLSKDQQLFCFQNLFEEEAKRIYWDERHSKRNFFRLTKKVSTAGYRKIS